MLEAIRGPTTAHDIVRIMQSATGADFKIFTTTNIRLVVSAKSGAKYMEIRDDNAPNTTSNTAPDTTPTVTTVTGIYLNGKKLDASEITEKMAREIIAAWV